MPVKPLLKFFKLLKTYENDLKHFEALDPLKRL